MGVSYAGRWDERRAVEGDALDGFTNGCAENFIHAEHRRLRGKGSQRVQDGQSRARRQNERRQGRGDEVERLIQSGF